MYIYIYVLFVCTGDCYRVWGLPETRGSPYLKNDKMYKTGRPLAKEHSLFGQRSDFQMRISSLSP